MVRDAFIYCLSKKIERCLFRLAASLLDQGSQTIQFFPNLISRQQMRPRCQNSSFDDCELCTIETKKRFLGFAMNDSTIHLNARLVI